MTVNHVSTIQQMSPGWAHGEAQHHDVMVRDAKKYMQDHAGTTRAHIVQRHAHIARIHIMCIHTTTGGMSHSAQCKIQSSWQDQGQSSQVGASYLSNCIGC